MKRSVLLLVLILVLPSFAVAAQPQQIEDCLSINYNTTTGGGFSGLEEMENENLTQDLDVTDRSDFEAETFEYEGNATVFTSPDSSMDSMNRFLDDVNSSLDVAVYLFNHPRIAERIADLSRQGVSVRVLVENEPVDGLSKGSRSCLDLIDSEGGEVRTIGGEEDEAYSYFHAKYMIKDNSSVMLASENFAPPGFSEDKTQGNRGWGIILESENLASYYGDVYEHDWRSGDNFQKTETEIEKLNPESGSYTPRFNMTEISGQFEITPVLSPDTSMSEKTILDMIRSAQDSIYVQQYYIKHWEEKKNPYLEAVKDAAERGVEVKILLDSTWYHLEEGQNDEIVKEINDFAENRTLDIEARLLSPYKNLLKSHNKGMVVDGDQVLISSINWNQNSVLQNREAGVIVENDHVGEYYSDIFLDDWRDTIEPIADAGRNVTVSVDENCVLSGENSWDDHNGLTYQWDIDQDGTYDKDGEEITLTFEEEGTYRIKLLTEDVGGHTDTDEVVVEVEKESSGSQGSYLNWVILLLPTVVITILLLRSIFISRS